MTLSSQQKTKRRCSRKQYFSNKTLVSPDRHSSTSTDKRNSSFRNNRASLAQKTVKRNLDRPENYYMVNGVDEYNGIDSSSRNTWTTENNRSRWKKVSNPKDLREHERESVDMSMAYNQGSLSRRRRFCKFAIRSEKYLKMKFELEQEKKLQNLQKLTEEVNTYSKLYDQALLRIILFEKSIREEANYFAFKKNCYQEQIQLLQGKIFDRNNRNCVTSASENEREELSPSSISLINSFSSMDNLNALEEYCPIECGKN